MPEPVTRREFLFRPGPPGVPTASDGGTPLPDTPLASSWPLACVSRRAMACEFCILMNAGEFRDGMKVSIEALEIATELEQQLSAFIDSSDVCRVNRLAARQEVPVGDDLFQLLARAQQIYEMTQGAFDVSASPLWRLWGFHRRAGHRPSDREIEAVLPAVGMHNVILHAERRSVQFARPGMEINLGGIGKGYAIDRIRERLTKEGMTQFLVQAGNSSVAAVGTRAGASPAGWGVNLPHPWKRDDPLSSITLRDRALGTSGSSQQSFHHRGIRYGHILDPRTGLPAQGLLSATAICDGAADADALATAFYVLGVEGTTPLCQQHPEVGAILVLLAASGQIETLEFNT